MTDFIQILISGLGQGSVYALVALGMTLIYRSTSTLNFAHGGLFMLGPFLSLIAIGRGVPVGLALLLSLVIVGVLGVIIDRVAFEPLLNKDHVTQVFATVAVGFILIGAARYFTVDLLPMAPLFSETPYLEMGDAVVGTQYLVMIATLIVVAVVLALFFLRTRVGLIVRATTQNLRGAELSGINVRRVFQLMWGIGAFLAALAGVLAGPTMLVSADMGERPMIIGLAAMVLGGFGKITGAVLGGILLGLLETFSAFYVSTALGDVTGLLIILIVLVLRPAGLLGASDVKVQGTT
ncbi:MAG: hypothetical protein GEU79_09560 [Acidimicrobiia bacterium]|nr:hypothetical protein [Acidimicrobiia bacterium]